MAKKNDRVPADVFLAECGNKEHTSYEDVAEVLGMKTNSVSVRLSQMKGKLGPQDDADEKAIEAFEAKWKAKFGHLATGQGKGRRLDLNKLGALVDSL